MSVMFQAPQLVDFCTGLQVLLHLGHTFSGHTTHSQPREIWLWFKNVSSLKAEGSQRHRYPPVIPGLDTWYKAGIQEMVVHGLNGVNQRPDESVSAPSLISWVILVQFLPSLCLSSSNHRTGIILVPWSRVLQTFLSMGRGWTDGWVGRWIFLLMNE